MRYRALHFKLAIFWYFFHVGLCSHTFSFLQLTWTHGRRWIHARSVDRVDPSPRDQPSTHVPNRMSKWLQIQRLADRHVASWGALIFIKGKTARSPSDDYNEARSLSHRDARSFPVRPISIQRAKQNEALIVAGECGCDADEREASDPHQKALAEGNRGTRLPRSYMIGWSKFDVTLAHRGDAWTLLDASISIERTMKEELDCAIGTAQTYLIRSDDSDHVGPTIVAHDRSSIVAQSPHDRGWFSVKLRPRSPQVMNLLPQPIVAINLLPRTDQTAAKIGWTFPLKDNVFLLCSLTFDRFVM